MTHVWGRGGGGGLYMDAARKPFGIIIVLVLLVRCSISMVTSVRNILLWQLQNGILSVRLQ